MERVGRYQLVRKLATGGMAEVFLAKAEGPGGFEKNLVVKRILPHLAERPQFVQMFLAEARIAAQLDHPNIVQIFDFGESEGAYFLAMEWVDGANLRGLNKWSLGSGEYLPLPLVARMIAQAAEGLAYAHDFADPESGRPLNLIHRDVSGENVLVGKTGAVKVLDFGIAKVSGEGNGTRVGALKGKLGYMPPEQVKGLPLDRRADVYALGVVLYQLLTGRKPYDQKGDIPLIAAILHEPPVPLLTRRPDLPPELVAVVEKAMAREKEARFADCREMQAALERFVARSAEPVTSQQLGQLIARCLAASTPAGASPSRTGSRSGVSPTPPKPAPQLTPAAPVASGEETLANDPDAEDDAPLPPAPQVARPAQPPGLEVISSMEFIQWQAEASAAAPAGLPLGDDAPLELAATSDLNDAAAPPLGVPALPTPACLPRPVPVTPSSLAYLPTPAPLGAERPAPGSAAFAASPTPVCLPRPAPARLPTPLAIPPVPVGPELSGAPLAYRPCSAAPEPLQQAVRQTAQADRSLHLLRRFPVVGARILEGCRDVPAPLAESLGAVLDAALLADDHAAVRRILEQALTTPGGRWAALVRGELAHPLRLAWLAERLRHDVPRDPGSLKAWLTRLGSAPALLWLIDELEPGPAQDLVCEALAPFVAAEPALVASRLDATPAPRNAGALWYVLEKADWKDRGRLLQKLMQRREPALQVALMGARARAGSQDAASLVACAVGERSEELRRCALRLLADMDDERLVGMLTSQMQGPAFEARSAEERGAYWAALGAVGRPSALAFVEQALAQKTTVLNRKKSLEAKLPALEALVEMRGDAPARSLERLAQDRSQPDELSAAARQALDKRRFRKGTSAGHLDAQKGPDRRLRLLRGLGLDLVLLVRATGAVDLATGVLDAALDRFRESVRQALLADGRFKLVVVPGGLEFNGAPLEFASPGAPLGPLVAQVLQSRDFRGFAVEAPVPSPELRAMLLRLLDPDGEAERLSHARVATFSGRALGPVSEPAAAADPAARARALHAHAVHLVRRHREALKAGRQILLAEARPLLDEWSRLYVAGNAGFLGLLPASPADVPDLHPPNAAVVSMAFAADLGLGRAHLRECAELALFHDLTLFNVPPERHPAPGAAAPDDLRLRLAWLLLAQNRSRRGPAYAVAAWESGLEPSTDEARSPGVAASVFALADAWDSLTVGARQTPAQALEAIQGRLRRRFHPQLLPLFAHWAAVQSGLAAS